MLELPEHRVQSAEAEAKAVFSSVSLESAPRASATEKK